MIRIKKIISPEYDNYPLIKYLKLIQPTWTKVFAIKMVRTKNVLINSQRIPINYKLKSGDELELYGSTNTQTQNLNLSKLKPLNVIYEDKEVIVVNKEIGITVSSDLENSFNNMNNRLLNHLSWNPKNQENTWKPCFIHRLDRNTSGLLIGAKTYRAYIELTKAMKEQKIEKYYIAKVKGLVPFKERTIKTYLYKANNLVKVVEKGTPGAKEAISEVKLIKHLLSAKESLLEVKLITGRTHQIRVHLSSIGFPIRGDQKYGIEKDKKNYPYPNLVAYKVIFPKSIDIRALRGKVFMIDNYLTSHKNQLTYPS